MLPRPEAPPRSLSHNPRGAQRRVAQRKLDQLNQAEELQDLRAPPGNRLEPLTRIGDA